MATAPSGCPTPFRFQATPQRSTSAISIGDGDLDLVISSFGAGPWRIYVNDGSGNFSLDQDIDAPSNPSCAVLLDFDNDGDVDLALSDEIADVVMLMQNDSMPSPLCPASPASCRAPAPSGKATLVLRNAPNDANDQIVWNWLKGSATPKADYGDPLGSDDYALCIYDAGALVASTTADGGEICPHNKPCWTSKPTSFVYANRLGSKSGSRSVKLKEGLVDGKASILVMAKGVKVSLPSLDDLTGPVTAQLHRSGGGPCFGATYSAPFLHSDAALFRDKAD
jgi:hypothetical protein